MNKFKNLPPRLEVHSIGENQNLYLSSDYNMFLVDDKGYVIERIEQDKLKKDIRNKIYVYQYGTKEDYEEIVLDFSYNILKDKQGYEYDFTIDYDGKIYYEGIDTDKKLNSSFRFGTDDLGRDILTRVMYGTRISLLVASIATMVNMFIGVIYGSVSGYEGGRVDNIMMRIVDVINSIPLVLYVILIMVRFREFGGLTNIIIALATVYWVSMARLVRGQMLSLKEQEFVLAARVIGVPKHKIIFQTLDFQMPWDLSSCL